MSEKTPEQKAEAAAKAKAKRAAEKAAKAATAPATEPAKVEITVTQEYLTAHPEIEAQGAKVGDVIEVEEAPAPVGVEPEVPAPTGAAIATFKKGEGYSILESGQYIRTYDNHEDAAMFCGKHADMNAIAVAESIVIGVTVEFDTTATNGAATTGYKEFTEATNGESFKADAIVFKNEQKNGFARAVLAEE